MKKTWWRVPVYCLAASWICFQLEVRLLLHLAIVTLPDGSISSDNTRSLIVFGTLFLAVLLIGGLVFFKKIGRRELLVSALIMVLMNISLSLIAHMVQGMFALYWAEFSEWSIFIPQLFYRLARISQTPCRSFCAVLRRCSSCSLAKRPREDKNNEKAGPRAGSACQKTFQLPVNTV